MARAINTCDSHNLREALWGRRAEDYSLVVLSVEAAPRVPPSLPLQGLPCTASLQTASAFEKFQSNPYRLRLKIAASSFACCHQAMSTCQGVLGSGGACKANSRSGNMVCLIKSTVPILRGKLIPSRSAKSSFFTGATTNHSPSAGAAAQHIPFLGIPCALAPWLAWGAAASYGIHASAGLHRLILCSVVLTLTGSMPRGFGLGLPIAA